MPKQPIKKWTWTRKPDILAERVQRERLLRGLTIMQLGAEVEIDVGTLWRIESGDTHNPQSKTLKKLADRFGCSVDYLTGRVATIPISKPATDKMEQAIIKLYRQLSPENQQELFRQAWRLVGEQRKAKAA